MKRVILSLVAASALAQPPGNFIGPINMLAPRFAHTATLLLGGNVLVAGGGLSAPGDSAELWDRSLGRFVSTGRMTVLRRGHTATLLPDGRVLLVGGDASGASAELYDPAAGSFTATGKMTTARVGFTSTLLNNGKVLIAGGYEPGPRGFGAALSSAELYDPDTGTFARTGDLAMPRGLHKAMLLSNGKVALFGSYFAGAGVSAYHIVEESGLFTLADAKSRHEFDAVPTLLTNGQILFTGGDGELTTVGFADAELYDPIADRLSSAGNMTVPRYDHTATLLSDGRVLIAGSQISGADGGTAVASAEIYDPAAATFTMTGSMNSRRFGHTATLLLDGTVLIAGGTANANGGSPGALAEHYVPTLILPRPSLLIVGGNGSRQGAILHADTHALVSQANPAIAGEALEIYCVCLLDDAVIPPQVIVGGRLAEVLWFGKAPGFDRLNQMNVRVPSGTGAGSAVGVRLIYLGRPSDEVIIAVRE
jgi:Galactose oxidase, central domain